MKKYWSMAVVVAARAPELIKCAAGLSGLYDLEVFAHDSDAASTGYGRSYITRVLGSDTNEFRENSPVNLASQIRAPVLLAHGEIDERTPYSQAMAMKNALEKTGRTPEWMSVPGEAHGFHKKREQDSLPCIAGLARPAGNV